MDLFRKYLTGPQAGLTPTGAETVERLTDRVISSTLLEDRRDAVRALKSLSKKFRYEVGTKSMNTLVAVIQTDRTDLEIIGYALDALCNVMSNEVDNEDGDSTSSKSDEKLTMEFSELFIKNPDNVSLLLSLLQEYDYHVLLPTIHLLTLLLQNKTRDVQEIILTNPMGISKMMDLLVDSREVVRNENMLLLFELTKGNTNIQKIVAFENAFERLFDIIREEGGSDGGVVVEDCLLVLLNLLRNNISNQNFLKEGSFIQRLPAYFDIDDGRDPSLAWPAQKTLNMCNMLKLIRILVSPNNPLQQITSCQKLMHSCGLLEKLSKMVLAVGIPVDALAETINSVAEIIRGNQLNQEFLASVTAPSVPPRSAIVVLLMSMLSDSRPFALRCAVLYCFQSFLYKNELGQSQIIKTLLPSTSEVNQISSGQLLCTGLFNNDPLSTWFSAISLLHSIINNHDQKEQLLRVQLATSLGNTPVTLIQQCANMLAMGLKFQTRISLLQLLCHWLADCSNAVTHFLHESPNVPYLISQVSSSEGDENEMIIRGLCAFLLGILVLFNNNQVSSYHKSDLRQVIEKRIGIEQYTDKLTQVSKHECYNKAAKAPNIFCNDPSEVIFDYEFTRLFKRLENEVLRAVTTCNDTDHDKKVQHDNIVEQYKLIIREQDTNLNMARQDLMECQKRCEDLQEQLQHAQQQIQFLKDQNALFKVHKDNHNHISNNINETKYNLTDITETNSSSAQEQDVDRLKNNVHTLNQKVIELEKQLKNKDEEIAIHKKNYESATKHIEQLCKDAGSEDNTVNNELVIERNNLTLKISELESSKLSLESERIAAQDRLKEYEEEIEVLKKSVDALDREKAEVEVDKMQLITEMDSLKKEQDDLLLLLTEQDTKIKQYRTKLKELGEKIDDDDDDEEDVGDADVKDDNLD